MLLYHNVHAASCFPGKMDKFFIVDIPLIWQQVKLNENYSCFKILINLCYKGVQVSCSSHDHAPTDSSMAKNWYIFTHSNKILAYISKMNYNSEIISDSKNSFRVRPRCQDMTTKLICNVAWLANSVIFILDETIAWLSFDGQLANVSVFWGKMIKQKTNLLSYILMVAKKIKTNQFFNNLQ